MLITKKSRTVNFGIIVFSFFFFFFLVSFWHNAETLPITYFRKTFCALLIRPKPEGINLRPKCLPYHLLKKNEKRQVKLKIITMHTKVKKLEFLLLPWPKKEYLVPFSFTSYIFISLNNFLNLYYMLKPNLKSLLLIS